MTCQLMVGCTSLEARLPSQDGMAVRVRPHPLVNIDQIILSMLDIFRRKEKAHLIEYCSFCGYDCRNISCLGQKVKLCPECGRPNEQDRSEEKRHSR